MNKTAITETVCHIDTTYRYTFYPLFGSTSGVIEIEVLVIRKYRKNKWVRIYMGYINPINDAVLFFVRNILKPKEIKQ